jgi:hypothetical protein
VMHTADFTPAGHVIGGFMPRRRCLLRADA